MTGKESKSRPHKRPRVHEGDRLRNVEKAKQKQKPKPPHEKDLHDTPPSQGQN